jgi:hypothetical protein
LVAYCGLIQSAEYVSVSQTQNLRRANLMVVNGVCTHCLKRASYYRDILGNERCIECPTAEFGEFSLEPPLPDHIVEGWSLSDAATAMFERMRKYDRIDILTMYEVFEDGGGHFHARAHGVSHGSDFIINPDGKLRWA